MESKVDTLRKQMHSADMQYQYLSRQAQLFKDLHKEAKSQRDLMQSRVIELNDKIVQLGE